MNALYDLERPLWMATIVTYLATIVAWCFWKYRCHRNLPALGAVNLQFTPRTAVGFYFLPLLNLFRPYQAMREIRWASNPKAANAIDCRFHHVSMSLLLLAWWISLILAGLANQATNAIVRQASKSDDISIHVAVCYGSIASSIAFLVATLIAACLVLNIARRQERRAARLIAGA